MPIPIPFLDLDGGSARILLDKCNFMNLFQLSLVSKRTAQLIRRAGFDVRYMVIDKTLKPDEFPFGERPIHRLVLRRVSGTYNHIEFVFHQVIERTWREEDPISLKRIFENEYIMTEDLSQYSFREQKEVYTVCGTTDELMQYMLLIHNQIVHLFSLDSPESFKKACPSINLQAACCEPFLAFFERTEMWLEELVLRGDWRDEERIKFFNDRLHPKSLKIEFGLWVKSLDSLFHTDFKHVTVFGSELAVEQVQTFVDAWKENATGMTAFESLELYFTVDTSTKLWPKKLGSFEWNPFLRDKIWRSMEGNKLKTEDCHTDWDVIRTNDGAHMSIKSMRRGHGLRLLEWKEPFSSLTPELIWAMKMAAESRIHHLTRVLDESALASKDLRYEIKHLSADLREKKEACEEEKEKLKKVRTTKASLVDAMM